MTVEMPYSFLSQPPPLPLRVRASPSQAHMPSTHTFSSTYAKHTHLGKHICQAHTLQSTHTAAERLRCHTCPSQVSGLRDQLCGTGQAGSTPLAQRQTRSRTRGPCYMWLAQGRLLWPLQPFRVANGALHGEI